MNYLKTILIFIFSICLLYTILCISSTLIINHSSNEVGIPHSVEVIASTDYRDYFTRFWDQFFLFNLGHLLTGILFPFLLIYVTILRDERKVFRDRTFKRTSLLADLMKIYTLVKRDVRFLEETLTFAKTNGAVKYGDLSPTLDIENYKNYERLDIQYMCAYHLGKKEHYQNELTFKPITTDLFNYEDDENEDSLSRINFKQSNLTDFIRDIELIQQSISQLNIVHDSRIKLYTSISLNINQINEAATPILSKLIDIIRNITEKIPIGGKFGKLENLFLNTQRELQNITPDKSYFYAFEFILLPLKTDIEQLLTTKEINNSDELRTFFNLLPQLGALQLKLELFKSNLIKNLIGQIDNYIYHGNRVGDFIKKQDSFYLKPQWWLLISKPQLEE